MPVKHPATIVKLGQIFTTFCQLTNFCPYLCTIKLCVNECSPAANVELNTLIK